MDSLSGEGITAVFEQAGTPDGQIIASKCFMLLEYTQKIEVRTGSVCEKARTTGGVKSVQPPSPEEATPLGETPYCGEPAKVDGTTPFGKPLGGTRVMTGSNGNNPSIMWQSAGLPATSVMEGYAGVSETERVSVSCDGPPIRSWLKVQSSHA